MSPVPSDWQHVGELRVGAINIPQPGVVVVKELDGKVTPLHHVTRSSPSMRWNHSTGRELQLRIKKVEKEVKGELVGPHREVLASLDLHASFAPTIAVLTDRLLGNKLYQLALDTTRHEYFVRAIELGSHRVIGCAYGLDAAEIEIDGVKMSRTATKRSFHVSFVDIDGRVTLGCCWIDVNAEYRPHAGILLPPDPIESPLFDPKASMFS